MRFQGEKLRAEWKYPGNWQAWVSQNENRWRVLKNIMDVYRKYLGFSGLWRIKPKKTKEKVEEGNLVEKTFG
jgi:hypothetical protein